MTPKPRPVRFAVSMLLGTLLAVASTSAALGAGWHQGSLSCTGTKTVTIWSRSSVQVEHFWQGGGYAWYYAPYRELKQTFTNWGSTWWTVQYDFESDGAGAYCVQ